MEIFCRFGKAATPVAVIQDGTTKNERTVIGTVRDIYYKAMYAELTNPAIIIVGEVVNLKQVVLSHSHNVSTTAYANINIAD